MSYTAFEEKDAETGVVLQINQDDDSSHMDPTDPGNDEAMEDVRFVVLHRRYQNPAERFGLTDNESVHAFMEANEAPDAEWFWLPLFLYDHSGTAYRCGARNPFSCPWDSGQVGIIAIKRAGWGDGTDAKLQEIAEAICAQYTAWANGNVWYYLIQGPDGETLDSCGGFIGDHDDEHIMCEARAAFEHHKAEARKDRAALIARQNKLARKLAALDFQDEHEHGAAIMVRLAKGEATGEDFQIIAERLAELGED